MANYNFHKDIVLGDSAQNEAIIKTKNHFVGISNITNLYTKEYDFSGVFENKLLKFEVKWDLMASRTGNVAIEYESRGVPSGISVSEADYWIYKINDKFYLLELNCIIENIRNKKYFREVTGGDVGSNTKMYLVKVIEFISWGILLDD